MTAIKPLLRSINGMVTSALCIAMLGSQVAAAASDAPPLWSLEIKGGRFKPAIDNWADYYDNKRMNQITAGLAYKIRRPLEIGLEIGYLRDRGKGFLPINGIVGGNVTYELLPVSLFILIRGVFAEDQWLVPYVGGGLSRVYYRETIEGQSDIDGSVRGDYVRAGLQLLLDRLDKASAQNMQRYFGVDNTYFFLEYRSLNADVEAAGVNIGGDSYLGGLLFEY